MILLSFSFLSFHVKFFPIVGIFPSPLHNLIFFSIRFDTPPPPAGGIRNLIQPCYCMENGHAFAVTLYLRNSFGGDASATGGESLNYSPCVPDTKKQDCGRDCWSQEDGTTREPDVIPPPRVARSNIVLRPLRVKVNIQKMALKKIPLLVLVLFYKVLPYMFDF